MIMCESVLAGSVPEVETIDNHLKNKPESWERVPAIGSEPFGPLMVTEAKGDRPDRIDLLGGNGWNVGR